MTEYVKDIETLAKAVRAALAWMQFNPEYLVFEYSKDMVLFVTKAGWFEITHPRNIECATDGQKKLIITLRKQMREDLSNIECLKRERDWYWK